MRMPVFYYRMKHTLLAFIARNFTGCAYCNEKKLWKMFGEKCVPLDNFNTLIDSVPVGDDKTKYACYFFPKQRRIEVNRVDENGKYIYRETGKTVTRMQKSTQMAEVDDARLLSSGRPVEERYAKFANDLKAMANQARLEQLSTGRLKYSKTANEVYKDAVDSLGEKLKTAEKNSPRERQAQIIANNYIAAIKRDNPDLERKELKKISDRALKEARTKVGAQRTPIEITDREWEAIQSGAISDSNLERMLKYTDTDELRKRATPRQTKELNPARQSLIRSLKSSGYTNAEIAKRLDTSISTVVKYSK